jgi:hypothetical protein
MIIIEFQTLNEFTVEVVLRFQLPSVNLRDPCSNAVTAPGRVPLLVMREYRQPGLLCTPQNFAQSSKFFKKKEFLLLKLPLSQV